MPGIKLEAERRKSPGDRLLDATPDGLRRSAFIRDLSKKGKLRCTVIRWHTSSLGRVMVLGCPVALPDSGMVSSCG